MNNFMKNLKFNIKTATIGVFWCFFILVFSLAHGEEEFQVNTYSIDSQRHPSVAPLSNGNFVVVWDSWGQDGSSDGVYGKIFNMTGGKLCDEFQVNTYTDSSQRSGTAEAFSNGDFVVAWNSGGNVYGQIFNTTGGKLDGEFQINTYTDSFQEDSSITVLSNGNFVVTWSSYDQDGDRRGVYGQIFDVSSTKVGGEFQVNTYTDHSQSGSSIAALSNGNFVVAWKSDGQDGDNYGIYGQIFTAEGAKLGDEFQVNTYTDRSQSDSSITALSNGNFIVAWKSDGQDGDDYGIYGQVFNEVGTKVSSEFQIETNIVISKLSSDHPYHSVAAFNNSNFVVTWYGKQDGDNSYVIYGQILDETGIRLCCTFEIGEHMFPSVAILNNGNFVVTWQNYQGDNIFGKIFNPSSTLSSNSLCAINADQTLNYIEDIPINFEPIEVWSFYPNNINTTMLFSDPASGTLNEDSVAGATSTFNSNSGRWEALGTVDGINSLLEDLTFTPATHYCEDFNINVLISNGNSSDVIDVINVICSASGHPVITVPLTPLFYEYRGKEKPIGCLLTITDPNDNYLQGSSVMMTGDVDLGVDSLGFVDQNGISGNYNDANGELVLTGNATVEDYQAALGSVTYKNNEVTFSNKSLIAFFTVNDGFYEGNTTREINIDTTIQNSEEGIFKINEYTVPDICSSMLTVAISSNGNFFVFWDGWYHDDHNTYINGRYGRILDANGNKLGCTIRFDYSHYSFVTTLNNGNFVRVWRKYLGSTDDGSSIADIYGQIFDPFGIKMGSEFQINNHTALNFPSSIATLDNDNFVVSWSCPMNDDFNWSSYGQRFDSSGIKIGSEFQFDIDIRGGFLSIKTLSNDNFVGIWEDSLEYDIHVQIFDPSGAKVGNELQTNVGSTPETDHPYTAIAALNNGNFAIIWSDWSEYNHNGNVSGQIFNSVGTKIGEEILITTEGIPFSISVATFRDNSFIVGWESTNLQNFYDFHGQIFDKNGAKMGSEFQVNNYTHQFGHAIATFDNCNFVVVWEGDNQNGDGWDIYGKIFNNVCNDAAESQPWIWGIIGGALGTAASVVIVAGLSVATMWMMKKQGLCCYSTKPSTVPQETEMTETQ